MLFAAVGIKVRARLAGRVPGNVDVEPVFVGVVRLAFFAVRLQMPFTDMGRDITGFAERFGERDIVVRYVADHGRRDQRVIRSHRAANTGEITHPDPAGVFAGLDTGAGWRTDRAGRVGVAEESTFPRQLIDPGRFVKRAAGDPEIGPAEVVDQEQHHVRLTGARGCDRQDR